MKNKILALCAFVAFSFVGVAEYSFVVNPTNGVRTMVVGKASGTNVFDVVPVTEQRFARSTRRKAYPDVMLGMGSLAAAREYRAVTGTDLAVNCFQSNDDGDDLFIVRISENRKFKNYDEFLSQLKEMLLRSAEIALDNNNSLLDPDRELTFFFGSGTFVDYGNGDFLNLGNFFGLSQANFQKVGGVNVLDESFLDVLNVQLSRDLGWRFDFPARSVKLISRNPANGARKFTWDSSLNANETYGYVRSGVLYLESRFYLSGIPSGSENILIQISFDSGEKVIFDGYGRLVVPSLFIDTTPEGTLVSVLGGMFGETYIVKHTSDLKRWDTNSLLVSKDSNGTIFPTTTNAMQFFGLVE